MLAPPSGLTPIAMPMSFRQLILAIVFAAMAPGVSAQQIRMLGPDESVRLGLEHNASLRAARADAAAAGAAYRRARAARFPAVSAQANYTRLSDNIPAIEFSTDFLPGTDTTFTLAPVELNRYYSELYVEQPVFTGFRVHHQIASARHEAEAAAQEAVQEEADVAYLIREAYWRLYEAMAAGEASDRAIEQVEAHLQDVQNRIDEGAALRSELLVVRTRRSEVRLDRIEAENAVQVARLELNRLIGEPFDTELVPEPDATEAVLEPPPTDIDGLVSQARAARPGLQALEAQIQASAARLRATRGGWFPGLAVFGRYVYARPNQYFFTEQDEFKGTWEAGAALQWDLFDGGARFAETQEARARLESMEARLTAAQEQVAVEVARQVLEARRAFEAIAVAEQSVEEAEEALRTMRQQYAEGVALSADVLDAEQALRAARAARAAAAADYAVSLAGIRRAVGEVW